MSQIIQGTTPTIVYTFSSVDVEDITTAELTFKGNSAIVLQKHIAAATVTPATQTAPGTIAWKLSQAETIELYKSGKLGMMCNWKTTDGTRGASAETIVFFTANHIAEVI